jgi:hypothetical protein
VPLGTEYSVPNGTEMVRYLISTNIMSLAGQVLPKYLDPIEIQAFISTLPSLLSILKIPHYACLRHRQGEAGKIIFIKKLMLLIINSLNFTTNT